MSLLQRHLEYIEAVRAKGRRVLAYAPPCCGTVTETPVPHDSAMWETLTVCPHCGELGMKVVTRDTVAIHLLEPKS